MKMVEAEVCYQEFYWSDCGFFVCKPECIKRYGKSANGMCYDSLTCMCSFYCK